MGRFRHEYKYRINMQQKAILLMRAMGVMFRDPHVLADGSYRVRSVYFDDMNDRCMYENLSGTDPRSKFRIRYYNNDISHIYLEKKSKIRGMCSKLSCILTAEECEALLMGRIPEISEQMPEEKQMLLSEMMILGMLPKVIVTYDRIPFTYEGGNVRVTFDSAITSSVELDKYLEGTYAERAVLPCGESILEVKWDEVMPKHLKDVLQIERLTWTAFSKYLTCRMLHL